MTGETEPVVRLKVFVSYSREDVEFADQLVIALEDRGFEPILDRHAIDAAENWRETLGKLVLSSDAVVYILTEKSAASPICTWEVEEAARLAKRIIPITPRNTAMNPPKAIADLNWIYFYPTSAIPGSGVFDGLRRLDQALRIDHIWLREQTRLSERAAEWAKESTEDRLLRGRSLREAEEWLGRKPANAAVAAKVSEYIAASAEAERDRERLAQTELKEREEALHKAEIAVRQVATAQSERAATSARLRILAFFSIVFGAALSAGAVYGLWLAADNAAKAEQRGHLAKLNEERAKVAATEAQQMKGEAQTQSVNAEQARAGAKELLASNVADLADRLVVEGFGPQAVLTALSGDPAALGEEVQRKYNPNGYPKLLNTLALAYAQSRLERSFKAAAPRDFYNDGVRDLAVSLDSKLIVSTDNQNAKLWTITGKLLATLKGHTLKIKSVAFSPDGKSILTGSVDGSAKLWNLSGQEQMSIKPGDGELTAVAFTDNGYLIATASRKGIVKIWKAADGALDRRIPAEDAPKDVLDIVAKAGEATSVAFIPGTDEVLVGYKNSIAISWTMDGKVAETYAAMQRNDDTPSRVNSLAFADSDLDFALAGSSGGVDIPLSGAKTITGDDGKTSTTEGKGIHTFGGDGEAWDVANSKDGEGVLVGFEDGSAWLWNRFGELARVINGHRDAVLAVAITRDGKRIVTGSADGTIRVESLASPTATYLGEPTWIMSQGQFTPDGTRVLLKGNSGRPEIWSTAGKKLTAIGEKSPYFFALSGDGKSVLMDGDDNQIERWSLAGNKISSFKFDGLIDVLQSSPKDGSVVIGLSGSTVAVYTASGAKLMRSEPLKGAPKVMSVAFSPQGDKVAASDEDGNVWVWTPTGKLIADMPALQTYAANDIKFSPDGETVLVAYSNNVARLWNIADKRLLAVFPGHKKKVTSVAFSPNGKWVATASEDMTARLWTKDGQLLDILWGHTDYVQKVGFSPDGKKIVTSSAYGPVRIWPISPILFLPPTEQVKLACKQLASIGITKFSDEESRRYRILEGANHDPCAAAKTASVASGGSAS